MLQICVLFTYTFPVGCNVVSLYHMKLVKTIVVASIVFFTVQLNTAVAQCSICTKTAQQMGDTPAKGLNTAILYLMCTPFAVMGYIGYRWWKNNKA